MCGVVIGNYSVRYRLKNGGGNYTTVHSPTTSVTLQGLVPNTEYTVAVAAINSAGDIGSFTEPTQFDLQGITRVHDKQQNMYTVYCVHAVLFYALQTLPLQLWGINPLCPKDH